MRIVMRIACKLLLTTALGVGLGQTLWAAEGKDELKSQKEKVSYGIGMNIGNNLKRSGYEVDPDLIAAAIKDVLAGKEPRMTEPQAREVLTAYQKELSVKRE